MEYAGHRREHAVISRTEGNTEVGLLDQRVAAKSGQPSLRDTKASGSPKVKSRGVGFHWVQFFAIYIILNDFARGQPYKLNKNNLMG